MSGTPKKRRGQYTTASPINVIPGPLRPMPDSPAFRYETAIALAKTLKSHTLVSPNRPTRLVSDGYTGRVRSAPGTPIKRRSGSFNKSMAEAHRVKEEPGKTTKTEEIDIGMDSSNEHEYAIRALEEEMERLKTEVQKQKLISKKLQEIKEAKQTLKAMKTKSRRYKEEKARKSLAKVRAQSAPL